MLSYENKHKMIEEINRKTRKQLTLIYELSNLENTNISAKELFIGGKY